jgi:hypothetical protein
VGFGQPLALASNSIDLSSVYMLISLEQRCKDHGDQEGVESGTV